MSYWEWGWRPSIFTDTSHYLRNARPNLKYILNDRIATDNTDIMNKLDSVKTWICLGNTAYPTLSNPNADFFIIGWNFYDTEKFYDPDEINRFTNDYFESHSNEGLYGIVDQFDGRLFDVYDLFGLVITDYEKVNFSFIDASNPVYLVSFMPKNQAEIKGINGLTLQDIP